MTKTKAQKARAAAKRVAQPAQSARRANRPKVKKRRQRAIAQLAYSANLSPSKKRKTFSELLVTDGLNKALQMHNSASIVDHFPRRMEKVCDIIPTSTSFAIFQALYLNPGNSVLFPIFSQIAATYEQFRWRFLRFHYVTEAYTASGSNVSAGKVIMATNADPSDSQFANSTQMENYAGADRGAPFSNFCHDALKSLKLNSTMPLKEYFVNSSANAAAPSGDSSQSKFYDSGLFQFATSGLPSASSVEYGELYVEFEVDMIRPKQQTPLGQNLQASHWKMAGTATAAAPLASASLQSGSNLNVALSSGTTITFSQAGRFLISYDVFDASISAAPNVNTGTSTATLVSATYTNSSGTAGQARAVQASSGGLCVSVWDVLVGQTVVIVGGTGCTVGYADLWISQVPSGLSAIEEKNSLSDLRRQTKLQAMQLERMGQMLHRLTVQIAADEEEEKEIMVTEESGSEVEVAATISSKRKIPKSQGSGRSPAVPQVAPERMAQVSKPPTPSGGWFSSS